jgi:hypothetical protein
VEFGHEGHVDQRDRFTARSVLLLPQPKPLRVAAPAQLTERRRLARTGEPATRGKSRQVKSSRLAQAGGVRARTNQRPPIPIQVKSNQVKSYQSAPSYPNSSQVKSSQVVPISALPPRDAAKVGSLGLEPLVQRREAHAARRLDGAVRVVAFVYLTEALDDTQSL